jgi:S-adenosylmethionine-diacylgycerolhomoserine-N-methlytransferase
MATILADDHGNLMDRMYRWQRYFYNATRKYYLLARDKLIDELNVPYGGTVLEIGCGTGRNLVRISQRWPECRVYGIDISAEMLKSAEIAIRRHDLSDRIEIAQGDAAGFDAFELFCRRRFDTIVCSYTLSMIPDWQAALRWALWLLAPQGHLHIVDFGLQERMPAPFRALLLGWLKIFHVEPRRELEEYAAALAKTLQLDFQMQQLYRDYSRICRIG